MHSQAKNFHACKRTQADHRPRCISQSHAHSNSALPTRCTPMPCTGTVRFTQEAIATCQLPTGTAKYRNRFNSKVGTLLKFHDGTSTASSCTSARCQLSTKKWTATCQFKIKAHFFPIIHRWTLSCQLQDDAWKKDRLGTLPTYPKRKNLKI